MKSIILNVGFERLVRRPHKKRRIECKNVTGIKVYGFDVDDIGKHELHEAIRNHPRSLKVADGWVLMGYAPADEQMFDPQTASQIVRDHLSKAGAIGGARTSPAKAMAARKNGKNGGRPKDQSIHRIDCPNCGQNMRHAYNYAGNAFICMVCGAQNDR